MIFRVGRHDLYYYVTIFRFLKFELFHLIRGLIIIPLKAYVKYVYNELKVVQSKSVNSLCAVYKTIILIVVTID